MLVEHTVVSNTNNAPMHWIVFMTSLYMYYALSFVFVEHSVCHESIFVLINAFTLLA